MFKKKLWNSFSFGQNPKRVYICLFSHWDKNAPPIYSGGAPMQMYYNKTSGAIVTGHIGQSSPQMASGLIGSGQITLLSSGRTQMPPIASALSSGGLASGGQTYQHFKYELNYNTDEKFHMQQYLYDEDEGVLTALYKCFKFGMSLIFGFALWKFKCLTGLLNYEKENLTVVKKEEMQKSDIIQELNARAKQLLCDPSYDLKE